MLRSIKPRKKISSLTVSDYFITLTSETPEGYNFKFSFSILKNDIAKGADLLKLEIYQKNFITPKTSVTNTSKLSNFLIRDAGTVALAKKRNESLVLSTSINLTNFIKNQFNTYENTDVKEFRVLKKIVAPTFLPIFDQAFDNLTTLKNKNLQLISQYKIDPGEAVLFSKTDNRNNSLIENLKTYYLIDALDKISKDSAYYTTTLVKKSKDSIRANFNVFISKKYENKELEIIFELYEPGANVSTYESIKKSFNILDYLEVYKSIKLKPNLTPVEFNNKLTGLSVTQLDLNSTKLLVQKKNILKSGIISKYSNASSLNLVQNENSVVKENNAESEIQIYRCISQKDDSSSDSIVTHKTIIAGSTLEIDSTILVLKTDQESKSIKIEVSNCPDEARQIQIRKRKSYGPDSNFGEYTNISEFIDIQSNYFELFDKDVINDTVYEYTVVYKSNDKLTKSVSKLHKFLNVDNKNLSVTIRNPSTALIDNKPVNTFEISNVVKFKEENIIKSALVNSDIYQEFQQDIENIKANFQDIIFYKIERTNLSIPPGITESFSTVLNGATGGTFSDDKLNQESSNVSEINISHSYHYEVKAFFKSPLTLLKEYIKTGETVVGKSPDGKSSITKQYKYKPYKWLQPSVIKHGTMIAQNSEGDLLKPSLIEDGEIGTVAEFTFNNLKEILTITNCAAQRFDEKKVILNWSIGNYLDEFDHFIIVKESGQQRKIIATTLSTKYIDELIANDFGTVIYYVIPVYNDYSVGDAVRSNYILYDPEEVQ